MNKNSIVIGVDIGGTNTVAGKIASDGTCVQKINFRTDVDDSAAFIEALKLTIQQLVESSSGTLAGIGMAAPAVNAREGVIEHSANLRWGKLPIVELIKRHFAVPVTIINDSNAAALGEMAFGSAKGLKHFMTVTLGTGLGVGIVVNRKLMEGAFGSAGELGHMILETNGRACGCSRNGCVETYVSATGLCRTVFELLSYSMEQSILRGVAYEDLTANRVYDAAMQNDRLAMQAFTRTGHYLGRMLANTVAAFDPEAIILTGGLMRAEELLMRPTIESFKQNALSFQQKRLRILRSNFTDGEGALLGAGSMVQHWDAINEMVQTEM